MSNSRESSAQPAQRVGLANRYGYAVHTGDTTRRETAASWRSSNPRICREASGDDYATAACAVRLSRELGAGRGVMARRPSPCPLPREERESR